MTRYFVFLFTLLPLTIMAQVVQVGGHYGVADPTTHRILVCLTADERDAVELPESFIIDNVDYNVQGTILPIVRLETADVDRENFKPSVLTLIDPEATNGQVITDYTVGLRHRGATATLYEKKSYAVKLDADASLLGMRNDNSWILDAMASDRSRMRNRVSTDLWLGFSRKPYYAAEEPTLVNGTRGRFVELFIADRYWGLYCLTEKVDRKQLRVKKYKDTTPRGIIYKSVSYDNMAVITDPSPSNESASWQGWEAYYPEVDKGEPFDWTPLFDLYVFLGQQAPSEDLNNHLHRRIDLPVWRDYVIFCDLIHADDNVAKNMITYYRDITEPVNIFTEKGYFDTAPAPGPLCICPWDLDGTWGRAYDGKPLEPTSNCNVSNAINYHIWTSQCDNGTSYFKRWAELRGSTFTPDGLWAFFEPYFDLFETSGAAAREVERWQDANGVHLDFNTERQYIRRWIGYRLGYLDGDYNYIDESIDLVAPETPATLLPVVTLAGRTVGTVKAVGDLSTLNLPSGLYIVGGKKVMVH